MDVFLDKTVLLMVVFLGKVLGNASELHESDVILQELVTKSLVGTSLLTGCVGGGRAQPRGREVLVEAFEMFGENESEFKFIHAEDEITHSPGKILFGSESSSR